MSQDHQLFKAIKQACIAYESILAAYIFGTQATKRAQPASDVDIALLLEPGKEQTFDYLEFKVAMERSLNKDVDLVILNNASEPIKHQVRRDGKLAFDRRPDQRKRWEMMSRKYYQDFLHLHSIYMQGFKMQGFKRSLRTPRHGR